jgi:hypothetical protein
VESLDGGVSWRDRVLLDGGPEHDTFQHVLLVGGRSPTGQGSTSASAAPVGYTDPPVADATGKAWPSTGSDTRTSSGRA